MIFIFVDNEKCRICWYSKMLFLRCLLLWNASDLILSKTRIIKYSFPLKEPEINKNLVNDHFCAICWPLIENHLLIYKLDRLKIDLHIKLERTIKLKYKSKSIIRLVHPYDIFLVEQIECYQDAGILLTIQDSKFIVRDLFSPDVELPDIIGMCPILNSSVIAWDSNIRCR